MTPSIWPSLLAFAAVLAAIPLVLAVLKRAQQVRPGRQGPLNLVAGLAVGPRERVAIIETGGRWLVVGITTQNITLLADLDQQPAHPAGTGTGVPAAGGPFAQLLSTFGKKDATPAA